MAHDYEVDEDKLEENEVGFFKCKDCGSRSLEVTLIIEKTEIRESVLPCQCGSEENAGYLRERIVAQEQHSGYVKQDRHIHIEDCEKLDDLDHEVEDEQIICERCYKKCKDQPQLWYVTNSEVDEGDDFDLTITCNGCDREIEFGYSHPNKQGRIFLGEDDRDFNPWLTFPDPKYIEKWKERNWFRPTK